MTLNQFVKSSEFAEAVVSSTQAGFGGGGYSVEIFNDGTHRVLDNMQIGNLYRSAGKIYPIPQLSTEQVLECDEDNGEGMLEVAKFYKDELAAEMLDNA